MAFVLISDFFSLHSSIFFWFPESKISGTLKTTEDKIPSKFVEAAGFGYLAYLKKGEVFLAK